MRRRRRKKGDEMEEEKERKKEAGKKGESRKSRRRGRREGGSYEPGTEALGSLGQLTRIYVRNKILFYKPTETLRFFSKSSIYHN